MEEIRQFPLYCSVKYMWENCPVRIQWRLFDSKQLTQILNTYNKGDRSYFSLNAAKKKKMENTDECNSGIKYRQK